MPWHVGLRDRALMAVMTYTFARISAAVSMRVEDYFPNGKRWWVRLQEKGGKRHEMPAHHKLEHFLDEYLAAAGIRYQDKTPVFRSAAGRTGLLHLVQHGLIEKSRKEIRFALDSLLEGTGFEPPVPRR